MKTITKFKDWENTKYSVKEEAEEAPSQKNAELLATLADLVAQRKIHIKNKEDFEAQILEIDIKLVKIEIEKNELQEKRKQLTGAKEIASVRRKEGKRNDVE